MKTSHHILAILIVYMLFQPPTLQSVPLPAGSSPRPVYYVIHLKNGNLFVTHRYWIEGNQLMFHVYGGKMGVAKQRIEKIVEMTDNGAGRSGGKNSSPLTSPEAGLKRSR